MLVGAVVQTLLLALPVCRIYTVTPLVLTLAYQMITTLAWIILPKLGFHLPNPNLDRVVQSKVYAQLPSSETGEHGSTPASQPLVVLHLVVQFNHPLGALAPGAKDIMEFFQQMNRELLADPEESGLLGSSSWLSMDKSEKNQIMTVYYFRSVEGVHGFAHGNLHRRGWDWYVKALKQWNHLGVNHEFFHVRPRVSDNSDC